MAMADILQGLGDALLRAGAPILKNIVVDALGGGIKGKIAGGVIDALAEALGARGDTLEKRAEQITEKIEKEPETAAVVVRQVEEEYVKSTEINATIATQYFSLLEQDTKSEGILSRIWRPLFALVFTASFGFVVFTVCYLMLNRELSTLNQLAEVTGFLTFAFIAGCAVLGVQVWKRTEEKKAEVV